ncbi:unnamed protein product, partial [Musa acuminata var. zebrina]
SKSWTTHQPPRSHLYCLAWVILDLHPHGSSHWRTVTCEGQGDGSEKKQCACCKLLVHFEA